MTSLPNFARSLRIFDRHGAIHAERMAGRVRNVVSECTEREGVLVDVARITNQRLDEVSRPRVVQQIGEEMAAERVVAHVGHDRAAVRVRAGALDGVRRRRFRSAPSASVR